MWDDGAVAYSTNALLPIRLRGRGWCGFIKTLSFPLKLHYCSSDADYHLCQTLDTGHGQHSLPRLPKVTTIGHSNHRWWSMICPGGHVAHSFLVCDVITSCWADNDVTFSHRPDSWGLPSSQGCLASKATTLLPPSFPCRSGDLHVPYSLVCDHRRDCLDGSDETFCTFRPCHPVSQLQCLNKQCVTGSARCDKIKQCIDGSDEDSCLWRDYQRHSQFPTPVIVEFSRTGKILVRSLSAAKGSVNLLCPETHFWCPDKDYCLPVFVRCNGVYDCLGHEDEKGCDVYTCPGFYRCRASKVCVHMSHVCDDWPLCPQHDDELLCDQTCPPQCTCHGLAFFCRQVFAAHLFPDLRYLDARGSGMSMHQFGDNPMLIHLSLATCGIRTVSNFTFNNLHSLDLSDNLLTEVSGHHFSRMSQLTVLFLAGNPLTSAFAIDTVSSTAPLKLNVLDLSRAKMHFVDSGLFLAFPTLQSLNLSHSGVELLQWNSSQMSETSLWDLDLRGCVITEFPRDVLSGFFHMQHLLTDDFKLCCPSVLTPGFDLNRCHVTPDDVSSCDDLLGSVMYRTAVAVLATLALLGNMVSLALRVCVRKTWRLSSGDMALTHLSVADLGLGLYLTTLGLADRLLAGQYVWQDNTWRRGAVCHLAGVLALSCRQATTFFTAILTLDRCSQRCQPLVPRLTSTKVKVICALNWASSLLLAALPVVLQWRFFGQQALCVPLPHTRDNSLASHYAFGVTVLVHIVMYGLCFVVEVLSDACNRITKPSIVNRRTCPKDFQFVILGSLTSGFLYTIACLVPVQYHTGSQKAAHTSLVYFGFVVSCAMNPYLHLCGVRVEHNKQIKEERLLKIVNRSRI